MKEVFSQSFPSGSLKDSITSITLANNTAKTVDVTCPTDAIWEILSIKAMNPDDVARQIDIWLYKEAAKTNVIKKIYGASIGAAGRIQAPNSVAAQGDSCPNDLRHLMKAGYTISVVWAAGGVSAGGTDADGLVIAYRELSLS